MTTLLCDRYVLRGIGHRTGFMYYWIDPTLGPGWTSDTGSRAYFTYEQSQAFDLAAVQKKHGDWLDDIRMIACY